VAKPKSSSKSGKAAWKRRLLIGAGSVAVAIPALWVAIHEIPGFGPALADGARAVLGPGPIAWIEDVAYSVADRFNVVRFRDAKPKTYWTVPTPSATGSVAAIPAVQTTPGMAAASAPPSYAPPFENVASEGDGTWMPVPDPGAPGSPPAMWKSLVHPDPKRSFAAVALVAVDLRRVDLRMMAGTQEPQSMTVPKEHRPGIVPSDQAPDLLAVFNGGFKAMHGHYGMMIDGETLVAPRDIACTLGFYKDGSLRIHTWSDLKPTEPEMTAYRQTPPCLVEDGSTNKALSYEYNRNWGAAVGGETIIRRSAIGLAKDGHTLFYGLGDAVTAQSLAHAMKAAGAENAAQLDVNYSYPRFLLYERASTTEPPKAKSGLIPDLKFTSWEYVSEASPRDFFYLTRRRSAS